MPPDVVLQFPTDDIGDRLAIRLRNLASELPEVIGHADVADRRMRGLHASGSTRATGMRLTESGTPYTDAVHRPWENESSRTLIRVPASNHFGPLIVENIVRSVSLAISFVISAPFVVCTYTLAHCVPTRKRGKLSAMTMHDEYTHRRSGLGIELKPSYWRTALFGGAA